MRATEIILIVIIILLIVIRADCGGDTAGGTTVTHDTVYVQSKIDTEYVPVPKYVKVPGKTIIDSFIAYEKIPVHDTIRVYGDYFTTYYYDDSIPTQYGNVVVKDTVTQNRIVGRGLFTNFIIPEITRTITIRERKLKAYAGMNASYPIGVGARLGLKTKDDMFLSIGADLFQGKTIYSGQVYWPINKRNN